MSHPVLDCDGARGVELHFENDRLLYKYICIALVNSMATKWHVFYQML